jgi:hypothetical protein
MDPILFMVTAAGLDALVDAQGGGTDPIQIAQVGLTANAFVMAPTITSLPGEIKRLDAISGEAVSETVIHMTAQDVSQDIYELRGLGLYLDDGTLFAVFSQATPLFRKVSIAFFLLALDIAFSNGVAGDIVFGDTSFLMPPATETTKGVAEIATAGEAAEGEDDERIITPRKLRQILDALGELIAPGSDDFAAAFAALVARTITGAGLVAGGGDLSASRVLTVPPASVADVAAGAATDKAVTPAALSGLVRSLAQNGYALLPGCGGLVLQWGRFTAIANGTTTALFPVAFPSECFTVMTNGGSAGGNDSQDNPPVLVTSSITSSGFAVFSADETADGQSYIAIGI